MDIYYDYNVDNTYFYNEDIKQKVFDFYKKDFDITILGPVGDKVENWKVKGSYIKSVQFGDLDWATETQVEIALTLGVDYCVLEY